MYKEAREYFNHCFMIRRELYGDEHINTVMAQENIAKVLIRTGNYFEARTFLDDAVKVKSVVFGNNHHTLAETYYEYGLLWNLCGNIVESAYYFERALEIFEGKFGKFCPMIKNILVYLEKIYEERFREVLKKKEIYCI
jgi:tetratricopeptide (TPR) repeat protein